MEIIFNTDDFGMTKGINYAVIDLFKKGIVLSTTMVACGEAFEHGVSLLKEAPQLAVGVHLNLTYQRPTFSGHKTIVDKDGNFLSQLDLMKKIKEKKINLHEVKREYLAQIERVKNAGISPSHLDSHHHIHTAGDILEVAVEVAKELDLPLRKAYHILETKEYLYSKVRHTEAFSDGFYGDNLTVETLIEIIKTYKKYKSLELMCHPAYLDRNLLDSSGYALPRIEELSILGEKKLFDYLEENQIKVRNYRTINL